MNGKVVGQRYQIVRLIGAGGMGSVYEAVDSVTSARVAVKLITAETAKNPTLMGRFEREARAAATIDTPHIVKVLDAGMDGGAELPFLVLELLEGEDVQHLIKRLGPLPPELALRIAAQACLGLDRAHEAHIIHRDIKPANFFLAKVGSDGGHPHPPGRGQRVVKLLDFGIAKIIHEPSESRAETAGLTRTGSMLGSPLYMSPEQARGHRDLDRRADIWSLGVVLYQALTGRTPHQDTDALGELIIAICTEEAAPIQEMAPWVPPAIAAVAHRAMRFAPDQRYQTASDMLDDLRPLLPGGWSIEESMFAPLADAERNRVAPRLAVQPDQPVGRGARTGSRMAVSGGGTQILAGEPAAPPMQPEPVAGASLQGFGATQAPLPTGTGRGALRNLSIGMAAAVALAAGGAVAYRVMRAPADVPPVAAAMVLAPAVTAPPPEVKPRTVKVVILPAEATVDVDGIPATPNDGAIEITGPLASVHKVRVRSGDGEGREILRDVVVTESGAIPPKVELAAAPSPAVKPPVAGKLPAARTAAPAGGGALPLRTQR